MANIEDEIARGNRAAELLRSEILKEAFDKLQDYYVDAWIHTSMDETAKRERLHISINVLSEIQEHLASVAMTGRMAADQIVAAKDDRYH
jgi:hypothetical protein